MVDDIDGSFRSDRRSRETVELAMIRDEVRDSRQPIDTAITADRRDVISVGEDGDESAT
jgi:hypothetical protein